MTITYILNLLLLISMLALVVIVARFLFRAAFRKGAIKGGSHGETASSFSAIFGVVLILAGAVFAIISFMMPSTVQVAGTEVANIELEHRQTMLLIVSGVMAIVGAILTLRRR